MVAVVIIDGKSEAIELPPMTEMQKLISMKQEIDGYDKDIAELEISSGIEGIKAKREKVASRYEKQLELVVSTVEFKEDKFLQALKKKGDSYREGTWKLIRHSTTRRAVNTAKFIEKYKDIALEICTIPVGKAEKKLGEETLNQFCDATTTYSYELVNIDPGADIGVSR